MGKTDIIVIELQIDKEMKVTNKGMNVKNNHAPNYIRDRQTSTHISILGEISIQFSNKSTNLMIIYQQRSILFLFSSCHKQESNLERPRPILQVLILLHLSTLHSHNSTITPLNTSIILQEKGKSQHHPLQAKDQNGKSTSQLQNDSTIFLPHI